MQSPNNLIYRLKRKLVYLLPPGTRHRIVEFLLEHIFIRVKPYTRIDGSKPGILFFPDYSRGNPYQQLLYEAINRQFGSMVLGFEALKFTKRVLNKYRNSCNTLHFHWLHPYFDFQNENLFSNFIAKVKLAKSMGYKIVWTVHNLISHETGSKDKELEYYLEFTPLCDTMIVHDRIAAGLLEELYQADKKKIIVCPHGSYYGYYPHGMTSQEARTKLGIPENEFVFLFFGLIRKYKGIDTLLEIFQKLTGKYAGIRLVIAGKVADKEIEQSIQKAVDESGRIILRNQFIRDEEIQMFFAAANISVLPFKQILTSGSAILSISFGKPVIVPRIGGMPELVNERTGLFYNTVEELEKAMEECVIRWKSVPGDLGFKKEHFDSLNESLAWDHLVKENLAVIFGQKDK